MIDKLPAERIPELSAVRNQIGTVEADGDGFLSLRIHLRDLCNLRAVRRISENHHGACGFIPAVLRIRRQIFAIRLFRKRVDIAVQPHGRAQTKIGVCRRRAVFIAVMQTVCPCAEHDTFAGVIVAVPHRIHSFAVDIHAGFGVIPAGLRSGVTVGIQIYFLPAQARFVLLIGQRQMQLGDNVCRCAALRIRRLR